MVRAVRWITGVVLSIAVWLGVLYAPFSRSNALDLIILYSPVAIIVSFGLFSLFFIIYGVVTFNDCPGEAEKLKQQIDEARRNLKKAASTHIDIVMVWSPVSDAIKWRRVISKFTDPTLSENFSISLGDWVYVDQISDGLNQTPSSQWYYGFKCGSSTMRGVFPVSCTEEPLGLDLPEIYAEIMSFLPMAQQMFSVGDRRVFHKATIYLQEMAGCSDKMRHSFSQAESKRHKCDALDFLSLCERYIGFPLQIRLPNPLSYISVQLYEEYIRNEKESKERERPRGDLFHICVELGRYPSNTLTLFLASQSMRLPDSSSTGSGSDQDSHLINVHNHLIEFLKGNNDGTSLSSFSSSGLQFGDFCRISENAIIEGSRQNCILQELKPFSPSDTRILLVIMADRVGSVISRRGRNAQMDICLSVGENERFRRPMAIACLDITKDLLSTLLPFHTPRFLERHPRNPLVCPSRVVTLRKQLVRREYPGAIIARPYGILEGNLSSTETIRNDFFVTIKSASFDKTATRKEYNVEVEISLRDPHGRPLPWIESTGDTQYVSSISASRSQPRWNELIRIAMPWSTNSSNMQYAGDHFSQLENLLAGSTVAEDHIEPVISSSLSLRSSGRSVTFSQRTPTSAHLRFIVRHRSTVSGGHLSLIILRVPLYQEAQRKAVVFAGLDLLVHPSDEILNPFMILAEASTGLVSFDGSVHRAPTSFIVKKTKKTWTSPRDKVLGVAFLPLGSPDEHAFTKDGDYSLFIHKMDEHDIAECKYLSKEAIAFVGPGSINSSGSSGGNKSSGLGKSENGLAHGSMAASLLNSMANSFSGRTSRQPDTLNVTTLLASNQYTTDEHLAKILSWRENMDDVVFCLKLLISHAEKESELKKASELTLFRIQLIDCLLQILSTSDAVEPSIHVQELHHFTVALLARLYRELNTNTVASELLEKYLQSSVFVYSGLHLNYLQVFIDLLSRSVPSRANSTTPATEGGLIDVSKICTVFSWAFKFIAKSRELEIQRMRTENPGMLEKAEKRFTNAVDNFFDVILDVAVVDSDQLLKSHIFKHISETIDPLALVYSQRSLTNYLERLVQRTIQCPNLPNHNILSGCLRSVLMEDTECRKILVPPIITNLKKLFSANLDITLEPCRSETNSMMTYFCNILTLFMERFVKTVIASSDTESTDSVSGNREFHHQFVQQGLLRWVMHEYGRILLSLQRTASSAPNSRPASSELTSTTGQTLLATQSPVKSRFLYLQPVLGCLASVFTSILQQIRSSDWEALLTPKHQPRLNCTCATCVGLELTETSDFLHELFFIFLLSHSWPAYPGLHGTNRTFKYHNLPAHLVSPLASESMSEQPWVEMLALQSTVELETMRVIFKVCMQPYFMCSNSSPGKLDAGQQKSRLLINSLQRCLGNFITTQPHLWLEELPTITVVATAPRLPNGCLGDLRVFAVRLLERLWQAIGQPHQTRYMEYFIPTVISASTEPVSELRKICVKMLVDMLRVNPLAAEPFLIRDIDRVMNWALPEFSTEILNLLEAEVPDGAIESLGRRISIGLRRGAPVKFSPSNLSVTTEKSRTRILGDMIRQINYLREYSEVITRRSKLSGMLAINNLRTYYDSIKRKDMTIRYLFKLEELHEQSENDIERGYTLERISGQYCWSSNSVDISEVSDRYADLGIISSSALKEALLLDALKYLKAGGDWKRAIDVCDQLTVFYRDVTADLVSLGAILNEQSQLYTNFVSGGARNQCCYKYYALHFSTRQDSPGFIGTTVVYRTLSQLNEVKMTLCEQFPEYHVETHNPQPLTAVVTQVTDEVPTIRLVGNLQPVPELPPNWASGEAAANLSPHIKAYYDWNQVRQFTRTYHFKPSKSANGKEMPVAEEVRYILSEKLPNIVSFMPVEDITTRTLSKAELVVNLVQDMSRSLSSMIAEITSSTNPQALLSNFVGKLSTSIHSPVSGGLTALLTSVNLVDDSADERQSEQLSDAIFQLLQVQAEGLTLCRNFEASSEAGGPISNLLPTMLEQFRSLIHEMSMKFGISVFQLQEQMQFGSSERTLLTSGAAHTNPYRAGRVYRRAPDIPNSSQSIRARTNSPLSPPSEEPRKTYATSLLPQTPPPLPERPSDLSSLHDIAGEEASRFPHIDSRRPPCSLLPEPDRAAGAVSSPSDAAPPPLPKKPPKPPPRNVGRVNYTPTLNDALICVDIKNRSSFILDLSSALAKFPDAGDLR
ncbi:Dedicator of cytokinesis protein [Echinococcus granulosus]|uniref:Dolichol-phosphate mannose synthase subunit 3 n=1 Tax=Echinococcus granulosus TaxID=6210 RepID=W6UM82_ECHGR|nr:Dedicator of cytokinesis protein [Echinococcus granulosus]EUB62246.1 Dedicator of cytokinesis protein [Echinococcus granulosus]